MLRDMMMFGEPILKLIIAHSCTLSGRRPLNWSDSFVWPKKNQQVTGILAKRRAAN